MRRFTDPTLVIATHNPGKLREIERLLKLYASGVQLIIAGQLGLPVPEETGSTYAENATLKALAASKASQLPALADDSGISITALGGRPGVHTADWAGPNKDFKMAMARAHAELGNSTDRSARLTCCFALAWPDGHVEVVEAFEEITLIWPPRGTLGFGYDPMILPKGETHTYAEMSPAEKESHSHRAKAFRLLADRCFRKNQSVF